MYPLLAQSACMIEANNLWTGWMGKAAPLAIVAAGLLAHGSAQAMMIFAPVSLASMTMAPKNCSELRPFAPAAPAAAVLPLDSAASKSSAILGGSVSALDRIRMQQAGLAVPPPEAAVVAAPEVSSAKDTTRCASAQLAMSRLAFKDPVQAAQAASGIALQPSLPISAPETNFLASTRVGIRNTMFTQEWDRVSHTTLEVGRVGALLGDVSATGTSRLQYVNRWVNRSVNYAEDRDAYGARDYWASASETLATRRGDCEDLAILKYQMLLSLGVAPADMYLTLARDLVRNADHAILIVRDGDRYFMLDNSTDAILPANFAYDYRPTLSFNSQSAWLHGVPLPSVQPVEAVASVAALSEPLLTDPQRLGIYLSVNAISSPRVMGLSR